MASRTTPPTFAAVARGSLRERKKEATRARLVEVSSALFVDQGYAATTLEQIAEGADISVPTLLVYFESKERLALAAEYDTLGRFKAKVEDPDRSTDTLALWRQQVEDGTRKVGKNLKSFFQRTQYLSDPSLGRGVLDLLTQYEDVLAAGLAADFGTGDDDPATRLLATLLSFGNQSAIRRWAADGGRGDLAAMALEVVAFAEKQYPTPTPRRRRAR
jgi:AcrR family transcriptional regulator